MPYILDKQRSNQVEWIFIDDNLVINRERVVNVQRTNFKNSSIRIKDGQFLLKIGKYSSDESMITFTANYLAKNVAKSFNDFYYKLIDMQSQEFYFLGKKYKFHYGGNVIFFNIGTSPHVVRLINPDLKEEKIRSELSKMFLKYLKTRQKYWEEIMNIPAHSIQIRQKSRQWACNHVIKKKIIYSFNALAADSDVLDYLIVHELAHHRHPNHQAGFWNLVAKYIPDHKARRKSLNNRDYMNMTEDSDADLTGEIDG